MVVIKDTSPLVVRRGSECYSIQYISHRHEPTTTPDANELGVYILDVQLSVQRCEPQQAQEEKGWVREVLLSANQQPLPQERVVVLRLAMPTCSGYPARSRLFEQRFIHCHDHLGRLFDHTVGDVQVAVFGADSRVPNLQSLVEQAVFGFVLPQNSPNTHNEILNRVPPSWLFDSPLPQRTVVLVHGRDNVHHYTPIYESATALNIRLVVLDQEAHWLQSPNQKHLCHKFVPIDMTVNDTFHQRIVAAVTALNTPVDGICTVSDRCLYPVALAAAQLGLPTESPEGIRTAIDKFRTRQLDNPCAQSTAHFGGEGQDVRAELEAALATGHFKPEYPLIVKPSQGWGSDFVYKVSTLAELRQAVGRARHGFNGRVLIEPYIDGPELDVNFVLADGEIVFFEMNDDFPSPGDAGDMDSDFWENCNVFPSALPDAEYDCVRESLHAILSRAGFRNGVFHLEARVQHSTMEYTTGEDNKYLDLRPRSRQSLGVDSTKPALPLPPRCFLIEINPRPPGFPWSMATRGSYGVNLFDAHILASLGDYGRVQTLCQPFGLLGDIGRHAGLRSQVVAFKVDKGGVCASEDACGDFLQQHSSKLAGKVMQSQCFFGKGDVLAEPQRGVAQFGAYLIVGSRGEREEVVRLGEYVRENFGIPVE